MNKNTKLLNEFGNIMKYSLFDKLFHQCLKFLQNIEREGGGEVINQWQYLTFMLQEGNLQGSF